MHPSRASLPASLAADVLAALVPLAGCARPVDPPPTARMAAPEAVEQAPEDREAPDSDAPETGV